MPVFRNTTALSTAYFGTSPLAKIMLGNNQVWPVAPPPSGWNQIFIDEFDVVDGYSLNADITSSPNWVNVSGVTTLLDLRISPLGRLQARHNGTNSQARVVNYTGPVTSTSQAIEVVFDSRVTSSQTVLSISVRSSPDGRQRVRAEVVGSDNSLRLQYTLNNVSQNTQILPYTPIENDVIRLECEGSSAKVFINGVQLGSDLTDIPFTAGVPALASFIVNSVDEVSIKNVKLFQK